MMSAFTRIYLPAPWCGVVWCGVVWRRPIVCRPWLETCTVAREGEMDWGEKGITSRKKPSSLTSPISLTNKQTNNDRPNTNTQTMIVPKSNRTEVYKYLFREGVIYAKKDPNLPKHPEIDVPNLQVIKLLQSLTSRELVKEQYAWQHYYWYLKDEGIEYLREYLNLPEEIVPATLKKSTRPVERRPEGPGGRGPPGGRGGGFGRDSYRGGGDRGPPRGGFGRGAPPA